MVDRVAKGASTAEERAQVRNWLTSWRDNHARLLPQANQSFVLKEVMPLSEALSAVANTGLEALALLENKQPASAAWRTQAVALTQKAAEPKAQLLLVVAPAIQRLTEATATSGTVGSTN
jgi:hypothetical protein